MALLEVPWNRAIELLPSLGSIGAHQHLPNPRENPEHGLQSASIELGVRIVEKVDRFSPGGCQKPPTSRREQ